MFRIILQDLAESLPGTIGVLFCDYEGETVEVLSERPFEVGDDDLRVVGAYQGIFLTQLRELCARSEAGKPRRFRLEYDHRRVFSCDLKDGYYVVVVVDDTALEATAWRELESCCERLLAEM